MNPMHRFRIGSCPAYTTDNIKPAACVNPPSTTPPPLLVDSDRRRQLVSAGLERLSFFLELSLNIFIFPHGNSDVAIQMCKVITLAGRAYRRYLL